MVRKRQSVCLGLAVECHCSPSYNITHERLLSHTGILWNAFSLSASFFKCLLPRQAFTSNTKFCSMVPEKKDPERAWPAVTIQVLAYKESLDQVLIPTLESCLRARHSYKEQTGAPCNLVVCDDAIMPYLQNDFELAATLWEKIVGAEASSKRFREFLSRLGQVMPKARLRGVKMAGIRMIYYYKKNIGFVSRSTEGRRGKFKKAGNMNALLRLSFGAEQKMEETRLSWEDALWTVAHDKTGHRLFMYGNDVRVGELIVINDADSRMSRDVIFKTVPEFVNDPTLGFTQHSTKTMEEHRKGSYFLRFLTSMTDFNYQGHFLTLSILGFHPPLVGHSIILRSEPIRLCGQMRFLRQTQEWLGNIGLSFVPIDQIGSKNLHEQARHEYWSENHISEDFEIMVNFYNLGYNGRYIAYPGCEFEEGITRTFDEEAERQIKFSTGAHELLFNPFPEMFGKGVFTKSFWTFLTSNIPGYYKVYLTSYLLSYSSGGIYLVIIFAGALTRILAPNGGFVPVVYYFSPASVFIMVSVIYYILSNLCFLIVMVRMHWANRQLFFSEYHRFIYMVWNLVTTNFPFVFLYCTVVSTNINFLGSMNHMLGFERSFGSTNKDKITLSWWQALKGTVEFNQVNHVISFFMFGLAYLILNEKWVNNSDTVDTNTLLFVGPMFFYAILTFVVPFLLNPYIWTCCSCRSSSPLESRESEKKHVTT